MTGLRDLKRGQTGTRKEEFQSVRRKRGTHEGERENSEGRDSDKAETTRGRASEDRYEWKQWERGKVTEMGGRLGDGHKK